MGRRYGVASCTRRRWQFHDVCHVEAALVRAIAWSVGDRLPTKSLDGWGTPVATAPLTVAGSEGGYAVLFRFGAVCAVGLSESDEQRLVQQALTLAVAGRTPDTAESAELAVEPAGLEGVDASGRVRLHALSVERAQVVASVLAKSVVLGDYEGEVAAVFERIEPFAAELRGNRLSRRGKALMPELGQVFLIQSRMVGRAEVGEKPEVTWDDRELDRLYERLALEYELSDREQALTRKLDLIAQAAGTYLDLLTDRRTLRVEWYIVILILLEILILVLYELLRSR